MTNTLRINGAPLGTDTVRVGVRVGDTWDHTIRRLEAARLGGNVDTIRVGEGPDSGSIRLRIRGPRSAARAEAARIVRLLKEEPVTLDHPHGLHEDVVRAVVGVRNLRSREIGGEEEGVLYEIDFRVHLLGEWLTDGGSYFDTVGGWFRRLEDGWERHDGETFTLEEGPRAELPEQFPGFPVARQEGTLEFTDLGNVVDERGEIEEWGARVFSVYNLLGFLLSEGDLDTPGTVGTFTIRSVPSEEFLGYDPRIKERNVGDVVRRIWGRARRGRTYFLFGEEIGNIGDDGAGIQAGVFGDPEAF